MNTANRSQPLNPRLVGWMEFAPPGKVLMPKVVKLDTDTEVSEQFLASWIQGETREMSLEQMILLQAAAKPEMPTATDLAPRQSDAEVMREIEFLVGRHRSLFQRLGTKTEGWNIAGER